MRETAPGGPVFEVAISVSLYNPQDLQIWQRLFEHVPPEWKLAPPSQAMEACLSFFIDRDVRTVLDIGCGVGRWAVYLAQHGLQVKGTDFSENAVRFAERWAAAEGLNIQFSCRPLTETAFRGEKFQGVVAALILDNVSRQEMLTGIERIRESLIDGGHVFALFNPLTREELSPEPEGEDHPLTGITQMKYEDDEIIRSFAGFDLLSRGTFESGMRAFSLVHGRMRRSNYENERRR
jgi:SAM-dependent methyltransferase